MNKPQTR